MNRWCNDVTVHVICVQKVDLEFIPLTFFPFSPLTCCPARSASPHLSVSLTLLQILLPKLFSPCLPLFPYLDFDLPLCLLSLTPLQTLPLSSISVASLLTLYCSQPSLTPRPGMPRLPSAASPPPPPPLSHHVSPSCPAAPEPSSPLLPSDRKPIGAV